MSLNPPQKLGLLLLLLLLPRYLGEAAPSVERLRCATKVFVLPRQAKLVRTGEAIGGWTRGKNRQHQRRPV